MNGTKNWYQSKGIWGSVIAVLFALIGGMGYTISDELAHDGTQAMLGLIAAIGGVFAWWGRVSATKKIQSTSTSNSNSRLPVLIVSFMLVGLTFSALGCQRTTAGTQVPTTAAEDTSHWTDANVLIQTNIDLGDVVRLAKLIEQQYGDGELPQVIKDELKRKGVDPATITKLKPSQLTIVFRNITIENWVDIASSGKREGSGATQTGGAAGDTSQNPTQENNPDVSIPAVP